MHLYVNHSARARRVKYVVNFAPTLRFARQTDSLRKTFAEFEFQCRTNQLLCKFESADKEKQFVLGLAVGAEFWDQHGTTRTHFHATLCPAKFLNL